MSGGPEADGTRQIEVDKRAAFFGFDALERSICWAVEAGEMEVAAEYAETLFMHADQVGRWHTEYMADWSDPPDDFGISDAMGRLKDWSRENDHVVQEWFDGVR